MIALLQRVSAAKVEIGGDCVGHISAGLLALIGVQRDDAEPQLRRLLQRILAYRVFADPQGRMNLSLADTGGGLLLVPQFTLAADTRRGNRPGFSSAAPPQRAQALFEQLVAAAAQQHPLVASGRFGADMQVSLTNDGPVTFWLEAH